MATFVKRESKIPWRHYLTAAEAETLRQAEEAKVRWAELNKERAAIQNRAIQRAKYYLTREA